MLNFAKEKALLEEFLQNFIPDNDDLRPKYMDQLQEIANRTRTLLEVDLDDLHSFTGVTEPELIENIETNTFQYVSLFADAADAIMPPPTEESLAQDVFDIMMEQRRRNQDVMTQTQTEGAVPQEGAPATHTLPPSLTRRYEVLIRPRTSIPARRLRDVGAADIGALVTINGIVTQVTDVRPLVSVATYLEDQTGIEYYQEVAGRSFNPLVQAPNVGQQAANTTKRELQMQVRGSKFIKYQEAKIQESPEEVPKGSTPRTIIVHLKGPLCRSLKAGDSVSVSGIFLPEPNTSTKSANRSALLTSTYLHVMNVHQNKQSYKDIQFTDEQRELLEQVMAQGDTYTRLANSIAPEIYGHEDVKKALLLALVGGVTKHLPDGMKIRGNIHICLMGDPGVAKSQLLRYVAYISPRAVYTTGKGSSGVGLTAAVMKDPTTGEMTLEGGALVMADRGVCCIDEFDKMEEADRTSIHEVMEQQTVSIAKAGITTTLNTRTTVMAAANPAFGRYDVRRSPAENINLPAALLSRFDILWLMLDRPNVEADMSLAQHVLTVHREGKAPISQSTPPLPADVLRAYVAAAKRCEPTVPTSLADYLAAVYAEMRAEEAASDIPHSYTTARTLLSLLRLSQALARLRFADTVEQSDVDEALRLTKMSKASLYDDGDAARAQDPISEIFAKIRQHSERNQRASYTWADLVDLLGTAFRPEQIKQCLVDYASINVWQLEAAETETPGLILSA